MLLLGMLKIKEFIYNLKNQNFKRISDMQFEKEDIIKKYAREYVVNRFLLQLNLNELLQKINIEMLKY